MEAYNVFLAVGAAGGTKGGGLFFEEPASVENIAWQTRSKALDAAEDALCAALTQAFEEGADSLEACAASLNRQGLPMSKGTPWTAEGLGQRLARLSPLGF